jgi:hypothetical protein
MMSAWMEAVELRRIEVRNVADFIQHQVKDLCGFV